MFWLVIAIVVIWFSTRDSGPNRFRFGAATGWSRLIATLPLATTTIPAVGTFFAANSATFPLSGEQLLVVLLAPLFLIAGIGALGLRSYQRLRFASILLASLALWATVSALFRGQGVLQAGMAIALVLGLSFIPPQRDGLAALRAGARTALLLLLVSLAFLVAVLPDVSVADCRDDKCSYLSGEFLAIGASGNVVGLFMLGLFPFALWGLSPGRILLAGAAIAIPLDLAAGRSAMVGAGLCLLALLIDAYRRKGSRMAARLIALPALVGLIASLYPLVGTFNPQDFTFRGQLWMHARSLVAASPLDGYGASYWSNRAPQSTIVYNYSPHNVWLELLVSLGIIGCVLAAASLLFLVFDTKRSARGLLWAYVAGVLGAGVFEATFTPYRPIILMAALPVLLALVASIQSKYEAPSNAHIEPDADLRRALALRRRGMSPNES